MFCRGAPENNDFELFENIGFLTASTNCYAYAVQDYGAGYIAAIENPAKKLMPSLETDFNYIPRPGQTKGSSYEELFATQPTQDKNWQEQRKMVMRQALKQDGVLYQGMTYPKKVPDNKYVICCFLEPNSYHFIRQNQDGTWSSKPGAGIEKIPSYLANDRKTSIENNPENFYNNDKRCFFVGYFFVPKGGIHIGLKKYIQDLPRVNRTHLWQILKEKSQSHQALKPPPSPLGQKENLDLSVEYIHQAKKIFAAIDPQIIQMRDDFRLLSRLKNDEDKKQIFEKAYQTTHEIEKKLLFLEAARTMELRALLKRTQAISETRRRKLKAAAYSNVT